MAAGLRAFHNHMIGPSDYRHPETGKVLFSISELKDALTPPLLTTQKACMEYIRKMEPDYSLKQAWITGKCNSSYVAIDEASWKGVNE